jgi:hypothetical protein
MLGKSEDWKRKARRHIGGMGAFSKRCLYDMSEMQRCRELEELMEEASGGSCISPDRGLCALRASHFH